MDSSTLTTFVIPLAYRAKRSGDKLHPWRKPLFGKTCATTQKNVKSHVFFDFEKNVKIRKKNVHIVSQAT